MFEAGFTYILSKSLMNTRTIVSIHNTSEYSLFFFYIFSKFKLLCIEQVFEPALFVITKKHTD